MAISVCAALVDCLCRDAGTISSVIALLQPGQEPSTAMLQAVLQILQGLAQDDTSRLAIQHASGLPRLIKLLEHAADDDVSPHHSTSKEAALPATIVHRPAS